MPTIIQSNPNIQGGQPVIKNTRITVARVLALIGMDYKLKDIKTEFPQLKNLTRKDLTQILEYYKTQIAS
jgi:uncharacterized protein (DUF433 family)